MHARFFYLIYSFFSLGVRPCLWLCSTLTITIGLLTWFSNLTVRLIKENYFKCGTLLIDRVKSFFLLQTETTPCLKNVLSNFRNNFMLTYFENSFLLDTAILYLQNKYNTTRHLLKTSFHYRVKHKSLESAFALPILDDKAVNSTINCFKHLKHINLLTYYLLPCPAPRIPITNSQSWWTVGHLAQPSTECSW